MDDGPHLWVWARMATAAMLLSWDRLSPWSPGWPPAQVPPASASQMLGLQANATTPGYCIYKERRRSCSHTRPLCLLSDVTLISVTTVSVSVQKKKKNPALKMEEAWELCECPNYVEVRGVCGGGVLCVLYVCVLYVCVLFALYMCVLYVCVVCCICVYHMCVVCVLYMYVLYVCVVCVCLCVSKFPCN